jgi:hypothetical protein
MIKVNQFRISLFMSIVIAGFMFFTTVSVDGAMTMNLDKYEPWSVTASSDNGEEATAGLAADNNLATRWDSNHDEAKSWIMFDYGLRKYIETIVIAWEGAFAKVYRIQVSEDGEHWRTVFTEHQGYAGLQVIQFSSMVRGRYVRLLCSQKASDDYGYSIYEFQVYGEQ